MKMPQRLFAPFLMFALIASTGCSSEDRAPGEEVSMQPSEAPASQQVQMLEDAPAVPQVTLETMRGDTIALAERPGEILLVNFWATWCAPCREEIPDLVALQEEFGPEGLTVIGVSFDRQGAEVVKPFLSEYAVNYPIVLDPEATLDQPFGGIYGLPMTFVVGPEGRIRYRVLGRFPTAEMRPKLAALLETPPGEQR